MTAAGFSIRPGEGPSTGTGTKLPEGRGGSVCCAPSTVLHINMAAAPRNTGSHPIVPIMLGDAALATNMAARMLERGIYVVCTGKCCERACVWSCSSQTVGAWDECYDCAGYR